MTACIIMSFSASFLIGWKIMTHESTSYSHGRCNWLQALIFIVVIARLDMHWLDLGFDFYPPQYFQWMHFLYGIKKQVSVSESNVRRSLSHFKTNQHFLPVCTFGNAARETRQEVSYFCQPFKYSLSKVKLWVESKYCLQLWWLT